jgi:hypothetical protein
MADITFIRFPYSEPDHFSEFQQVMAAAAGHPTLRFSGAEIRILPKEPVGARTP